MTRSTGMPGLPPNPQSATVAQDLPCRKCSYNLRGLPTMGRCPECGTPVGLSLQGDLLRFSDPTWVEKLRLGVNFIIGAICVIIFGVILAVIIGAASGARGATGGAGIMLIVGLIVLIGYGMIAWGTWLLTEPDPSGVGEDKYGTSRRIIRITLLIGVCSQVTNLIDTYAGPPPTLHALLQVFGVIAGISGVVGLFAQLQYLKKLAMRIPDMAIADRAGFLMWAIGISYILVILIGALAVVLASTARGGGGPPPAAMGLGCFMMIVGICLIVFGIMYLLMLEKMGRAFKAQARIARDTWAAQTFAKQA